MLNRLKIKLKNLFVYFVKITHMSHLVVSNVRLPWHANNAIETGNKPKMRVNVLSVVIKKSPNLLMHSQFRCRIKSEFYAKIPLAINMVKIWVMEIIWTINKHVKILFAYLIAGKNVNQLILTLNYVKIMYLNVNSVSLKFIKRT